ncbi:MAG: hypothetical protein ACRDL4_04405 [Thermoleophilaceae bacterium]
MTLSNTDPAQKDEVQAFVEEALRIGIWLTDLLAGLLDDLPEEAFPGENPAEALIEMLVGTIRPAAQAAGTRTVRQATALLGAMGDRVLSDLRAAADRAASS